MDDTSSGNKHDLVCRISFLLIILLSVLMNTMDFYGKRLSALVCPVLPSLCIHCSCESKSKPASGPDYKVLRRGRGEAEQFLKIHRIVESHEKSIFMGLEE